MEDRTRSAARPGRGPGRALACLAPLWLLLAGCAAPAVLAVGGASAIGTGKGLTDHALDAATGEDCSVVEGAVRADRKVCERPGSPATREDFDGVLERRGPAAGNKAAEGPGGKGRG
jgi:hypothetical protein